VSRARSWTRALGVLVLVGALAAVFAGPASAYTKREKRHIQRVLLHQLKKHPRLIKNKHWLRKADHVQEVLPLTIRLNPFVVTGPGPTVGQAASDDTASLDFSDTFGPEVGVKSTHLNGVVHVDAHFGNPQDGDTLGSLRLVVTSASLSAASVGILNNSTASSCAAPPDSTLWSGGTVGSSAAAMANTVQPDTVVRTAPIPLTLASTAAPNVGTANLFSSSNNVRLSLHANAAVNTIFRIVDDGTGGGNPFVPPGSIVTALFNCDEAYAAQTTGSATENVIPVNVTGTLKIAPALTVDGRLRIATVTVSTPAGTGEEVGHSTIDACLQPATLVDTPTADAHVNAFTSGASSGPPFTSTTPPTADCDSTFNASNFPLASLGEQEITPTTAKRLHLDPNVDVTNLTGEALIGTYAG
jgi:hypothetical protein